MIAVYIEGHRGEDEDFKVEEEEDDFKSRFSLLQGGIT